MVSLIKNPVPIEPDEFVGFGVKIPQNFNFASKVGVVPIGFSEIVPCSLWYPIFFGLSEGSPLVLASLGTDKKTVFLNTDGSWKVSVMPGILQIYPFGVLKTAEEEYTVVVEEEYLQRGEGELLFTEEGETPFFQNVRARIEALVRDLHEASLKTKEIIELGLVQKVNFYHRYSFGEIHLKGALTADVRKLSNLQPEKIYHLLSTGTLPALLAQNLSMRNFALFELFYGFKGKL